jgi:hypothetical protein
MVRFKSTLAFSLLLATSLVSLGIVAQTSAEKTKELAAAKPQTDSTQTDSAQTNSAQTQNPKTDTSSTNAAISTATTTTSNQTVKKTKKESGKESQDKRFIPSEEISEDFAVSFPVDI